MSNESDSIPPPPSDTSQEAPSKIQLSEVPSGLELVPDTSIKKTSLADQKKIELLEKTIELILKMDIKDIIELDKWLTKEEETSDKIKQKKIKETLRLIRGVVRAVEGQSEEEDIYNGMIKIDDIRERTRLYEHDVYGHSYLRILSQIGDSTPHSNEWDMALTISEMEDHYKISEDGLQWAYAVLMQKAKTQQADLRVILPNANPVTPNEQEEQKAFEKEQQHPSKGKKSGFGRLKFW